MSRAARPDEIMTAWMNATQMMVEAHSVIAYRMLGMAGLWAVTPMENRLMMDEKGPAFVASSMAATRAMLSGKRPDEILNAAVRPLGRTTRANARRLSRRGPRFG